MMRNKLMTDTTTLIGIDYSLTSPAVCIDNGALMFFFLTNKKKYIGKLSEDIIGYEHKEWTTPIQRFTYISDFVFDIINQVYNPKVFIEGYSFGSKGQAIFQIAENCGILKYSLLNSKIEYNIIVPSIVKKFATDKGNANKDLMYEHFCKDTKTDLMKTLDMQTLSNPVTDIVDAYYIARCGYENIKSK